MEHLENKYLGTIVEWEGERWYVDNTDDDFKEDGEETSLFLLPEKYADSDECDKMDPGFRDLFDKEVDYELYIDNGDESTSTDMYGQKMKYTDVQTAIDYLEKLIDSGETYRRLPLLLGLLKGIDTSQWNEIQIVHYGY